LTNLANSRKKDQQLVALRCFGLIDKSHHSKEERYEAYRKFFGFWRYIEPLYKHNKHEKKNSDEKEKENKMELTPHHLARTDLQLYHQLLKQEYNSGELSYAVTHPEAMPVDVPSAESDEFNDICNAISSFTHNDNEDKNDKKKNYFPELMETYPLNPDQDSKKKKICDGLKDKTWYQTKRGTMISDGRVDLCKQAVGPVHIRKIVNSMRDNPYITKFESGNNVMGLPGCEVVSDLILDQKKKCRIDTWYLAGNNISAKGLELLIKAWTHMQNHNEDFTKMIWLKRNPIGSLGGLLMGHLLQVPFCTLRTLDLHNTNLGDQGLSDLLHILKDQNTGLSSLYVDANGLTVESGFALGDYFLSKAQSKQKGLEYLSLSMNRLGDVGLMRMLQPWSQACMTQPWSQACMTQPSCFSYSYPYLKSLNVGSNRFGTNGLSALVFSLVTQNMFPELELLDIGTYKATADMGELPNHFETQQDYELLHQLITCPNLHLRSLQMNTCHIPPEHLLLLSYILIYPLKHT
jgi:hypothetical protein